MTDQATVPGLTTPVTPRIESLLSSRLFVAPQLAGDTLYFISNLGGSFSLYAMEREGSVPVPLLPPGIALQNPELVDGYSYRVFPRLGKILVMIDRDGDENYRPMLIPLEGGIPEPAFGDRFATYRSHLAECDTDTYRLLLAAEARDEARLEAWMANLETGELIKLGEGRWGPIPAAAAEDGSQVVLEDQYTFGDTVLRLWERGRSEARLLYGTPLEARQPDLQYPPNGIGSVSFTEDDAGLLFVASLFDDAYGLGYLEIDHPEEVRPVRVTGIRHQGSGEMEGTVMLNGGRYQISYNIDGVSWVYEGTFDAPALEMRLERVLVGEGALASGTIEAIFYDKHSDSFVLSFSTATSPTQLYVLGPDRVPVALTHERVLGIPMNLLSAGEDASFISHDGLRISARLYLPAEATGFTPPFPLVYYIHGGPQGQERPNFAWFSMPLIQFLTLNGFAVFVPNVRGSTGYGMDYMKRVDRDWGGQDRLDHVHAMTKVLPRDQRLDVQRAAVVGRSYGGYMTLTLAARHPELWAAACDMFGPYDLSKFMERIPETWKPYFIMAVGNPETEMDFLRERSPQSYIDQIACPLLVIQGRNDPRVVEQESRDLVERLRSQGKEVEFLVFANEGHDVLKFENRVTCYNAITDFFRRYLKP